MCYLDRLLESANKYNSCMGNGFLLTAGSGGAVAVVAAAFIVLAIIASIINGNVSWFTVGAPITCAYASPIAIPFIIGLTMMAVGLCKGRDLKRNKHLT